MDSEQIPEVVFCCHNCRGILFDNKVFQKHKQQCTGSVVNSSCTHFICDKPSVSVVKVLPENFAAKPDNLVSNASDTSTISDANKLLSGSDAVVTLPVSCRGDNVAVCDISTALSVSHDGGAPSVSDTPASLSIPHTIATDSNGEKDQSTGKSALPLLLYYAKMVSVNVDSVSASDRDTSGKEVRDKQSTDEVKTESVVDRELHVVITNEGSSQQVRHDDTPSLNAAHNSTDTRGTAQCGTTQDSDQSAQVSSTTEGAQLAGVSQISHWTAMYESYRMTESCQIKRKVRKLSGYKCEDCRFSTSQVELFHVHMTKKHALDVIKRTTNDPTYSINRQNVESTEKAQLQDSRRSYYRQRNKQLEIQYEKHATLDECGKQTYRCPACEWSTSRGVGMLHRHVTSLHEWADGQARETVWKCESCTFDTNVRRKYVTHMQRHERLHGCEICHRRFITKKNLTDHTLLHTGECPLKCDYEGCNYSTIQKRCLDEHKRKHTGERLTCEFCGFSTVYATALRNHVNMKHKEKTKYRCTEDTCKYVTNDKSSFEKHVKCHNHQKDFKCCHCEYRSVSKSQVVSHLQRVHNNEKAYGCDKCNFTTGYPLSLRYHLMAHMGIKCFRCPHCTYSSLQKVKIVNHIISKHPAVKTIEVINDDVQFDVDLSKYRLKNTEKQPRRVYTVTEMEPHSNQQIAEQQSAEWVSLDELNCTDIQIPLNTVGIATSNHVSEMELVDYRSVISLNNTELSKSETDANLTSDALVSNEPVFNNVDEQSTVIYQCSECEFISQDYDTLVSHLVLHRGIHLYQCPQCGFSSPQIEAVQEHVTSSHPQLNDMTINEISMSLETDNSESTEGAVKLDTGLDNMGQIQEAV